MSLQLGDVARDIGQRGVHRLGRSRVYAASRAGLISLARTLSGKLIGCGMCGNLISPGPVTTPI